jgi:hypothetical protein
LDVLGRERLNLCPCYRHVILINNGADYDRVAFRLLNWLRDAARLEPARERDECGDAKAKRWQRTVTGTAPGNGLLEPA